MTTASPLQSIEMAASSSFSYAQAAKGQQTNGTAAGQAAPVNPEQPTQTTTSDMPSSKTTAERPAEVSDSPTSATPRSAPVESQTAESVVGSDSDARSDLPDRRNDTKREDESRTERPWRRNEKAATRSSSATTRSVTDEADSRRPRKGKKGKASGKAAAEESASGEKDQEPEIEQPKIELAEAPIPSVNIWHQRKEAQQAKSTPSSAANSAEQSNGAPHVDVAPAAAQPNEETVAATTSAPVRANATVNGTRPHRKAADAPQRAGSRGTRLAEKDAKDSKSEMLPPLADSVSWPTPDTVQADEKKKALSDKADPSDKDSQEDAAQAKSRREWVPYGYTPTVIFETQLPDRGAKPRKNGSNPRTTNAPRGDQSGDLAAPAATGAKAKERPREATEAKRNAHAPNAATKRNSVDASQPREVRKPAPQINGEKSKDAAAPQPAETGHSSRENRGERWRGNYRGRGGPHSINTHSHGVNGFPSSAPTSARSTQSPYSPPGRQGAHGSVYMNQSQRGGRGGRNGAGANFNRMSLPNGGGRAPQVQSQYGHYDYPMAMPPMPYQPQPQYPWDGMVMPLLKQQVEYYFSIENLCKDMFLRKRMDSQGFVPLSFVASFKRVRELASDTGLVRVVCEDSNEIDYILGDDDVERLRRRDGWEKFVMPMTERDEAARTNGPMNFSYKSRSYHYGAPYNNMSPLHYGMAPTQGFPAGSHEQPFQPFVEGQNGMVNGNGHSSTPLSADVPDFSPTGNLGQSGKNVANAPFSQEPVMNGHADSAEMANGVHEGSS